MLVRITEKCNMKCSHCLVNSHPDGEHMKDYIWDRALAFIQRTQLPIVTISGGEPTEHPQILTFISRAKEENLYVTLLSNGSFLENEELTEAILRHKVMVQITYDPRFYPREPNREKIQEFLRRSKRTGSYFQEGIRIISPHGRAQNLEVPTEQQRLSPSCFNLRSVTTSTNSFLSALYIIRSSNKYCTPSINIDGSLRAGETPECKKIGTVDDSFETLTENILKMRCDNCGLTENLPNELRRIIHEEDTIEIVTCLDEIRI